MTNLESDLATIFEMTLESKRDRLIEYTWNKYQHYHLKEEKNGDKELYKEMVRKYLTYKLGEEKGK